jgi:hypothetical protein
MAEVEDHPSTPFQIGYSRLLGAVLANALAHVISAPLAAFIVHEGSRFVKSHDTVTLPMPAFFKKQLDVKLEYRGKRSYFNNLLFNYQFRPKSLENISAYEFFEQYEMTPLKKNDHTILSFQSHHPGKKLDGIRRRSHHSVPILGFSNFINTSNFNGHSILDASLTSTDMETDILDNMATYAQQVLMLFLPWRHQNVLDMSPIDSIACLQHFYEIGKITPFHLQLLQNVQDCYDSLSSDIPPDPLESCTRDLIEDSTFLDEDKNELIEQLLSEDMSEVAAILSETMFSDQQDGAFQNDHIHSISLDKIRSQGGHNCGFHLVQPPALSIFHQQFIFNSSC